MAQPVGRRGEELLRYRQQVVFGRRQMGGTVLAFAFVNRLNTAKDRCLEVARRPAAERFVTSSLSRARFRPKADGHKRRIRTNGGEAAAPRTPFRSGRTSRRCRPHDF